MVKRPAVFQHILLFLIFSAIGRPGTFAQDSLSRPNYRALRWILAGETVAYSASIYGLSKAWYKTPFTRFNVVDDAHEWQQLDKVGHFFTAYQICRGTAAVYQKTGITRRQAALYGALSGFLFLTPIEILDGFQYPVYGFSPSDMVANIAGPSLYLGQYALWGEERIQPKFSFHPTALARVRPELLGRNFSEQWLKDYNGQTYWFSVNLASFAPDSRLPKWLSVSLGYGIHDMVGAEIAKSRSLGYAPYRQYYLSLDVDFRKIPTRSKPLKTLFFLLNTLKVPAPTLEWNRRQGFRGHWLSF
ncbi:MAG: YfiM family protein [Spirosomaceae bacterium]|nr:YfiM family protein [Spirosomataceae bacterium]